KKLVVLIPDFLPRILLQHSRRGPLPQVGNKRWLALYAPHQQRERVLVLREKESCVLEHFTVEHRIEGEDAVTVAHRFEERWIGAAYRVTVDVSEAVAVQLLDHRLIVNVPAENHVVGCQLPQPA